jgi:hypothetical protein
LIIKIGSGKRKRCDKSILLSSSLRKAYMALSSASIALVVVSLATLALGFQIWWLTSSRAIILNTVVATAGLLFAAFKCSTPGRGGIAYVIPFLVAMLFAGRGVGTYWRSRKETALRLPSTLMSATAAFALCDYCGLLCVLAFTDPPNGEVLQFSGIPKTHFILNPSSIGVYRRSAQLKCFGNLTSRLATSNQILNFHFAIS